MRKLGMYAILLCFAFMAGPGALFADEGEPFPYAQLFDKTADEWTELQAGVWETTVSDGVVLRFAFGASGMDWAIDRIEGDILKLLALHFADPGQPQMARIESLLELIDEMEKQIDAEPRVSLKACTVSWDAWAIADGGTSSQGTWSDAYATAEFFSTFGCSSGTVYSYAKAYNSSSSTTDIDGPRSGANVTATASAHKSGGVGLGAYARAYVSAPGIYLERTSSYPSGGGGGPI